MNYDEVAKEIFSSMFNSASPVDIRAAIAAALRRAANEAAWDGYRTKRDIIGAAKMTEKYGPKEARDE